MNYYIVGFRAIAIVCIIFHHCFCIYQGWPPGCGLGILPVYAQVLSELLKWIGLSLFVFILGFCMYYSKIFKKTYRYWLKGKIHRILLPMVLFSILYYFLYPQFMFNIWPAPINGTHLWFLPMLFLCMLIMSIHLYYPNHSFMVISMIYIIVFLINIIVPFRTFDKLTAFFPIFVLGYWAHYKGLLSKTVCHISLFRSYVIQLLSQQSFKLYLLHQFLINWLLVTCIEQIRMTKYYLVFFFIALFSLMVSLAIGLLYDKLLNIVHENNNK